MDISLLQKHDLLLLRDHLNECLKKVGVGKEKAKAIIRIVLMMVCVGGGVATAILLPSPLTLPILGGLGFLFTRNFKSIKRIRKKKEERMMLKSKIDEVNKQIG